MTNESVRVSLVVLNYNGATTGAVSLTSLACSMGDNDELIVVDNAVNGWQHPDRQRFLRRGTAQTACGTYGNNYIFGLNDGLAVATGRYVAFLNNDNVFESASIDSMLAHFASPKVFAVCPRIVRAEDGRDQGALTSGYWRRGLLFYAAHPHRAGAERTFFAVGGQSIFDRAKLVWIGSIDPLLYPMYHEDIELSWRAWKAGYEIRYASDAVIRHVGGHASSRAFTSRQLRALVRQNEFLIVWKNVTDKRLLAEHLVLLPPRLVIAAVKRDWPTITGFWSALGRMGRVREARASARVSARLADRAVLRLVSAAGLGIGSQVERDHLAVRAPDRPEPHD